MRILFLLCFLTACSTTKKISNNLNQTNCHMIFGNCEKQMLQTCNNGVNVTSEGTRFGFWGLEKEIFYECKEWVY